MPRFKQVTIVGLGLIGGSLGMALRRRRLAQEVVGLSRSVATLRRARGRGAIDRGTTDPACAVADADVVVLATPVEVIVPAAMRLARFMRPGSVLTDVGSTKAVLVSALERRLPRTVRFVGGHPLAGSEQRGIEAAAERLFDGAICILTPTARTDPNALREVRGLWTPLVDRVITMSPRRHDRLLAGMSHLPHLVACCLAQAVETPRGFPPPRSFMEMTRIAKSSPALWDDIFCSNRAAVMAAMEQFSRRFRLVRARVAAGDRAALQRLLRRAQVRRHALETR